MKLNMRLMIFWGLLITFAFAGCSDLEKNRGESINEIKIVFLYKNVPYERERFPIEKGTVDYKLMLKYFDGSKETYTEGVTWTSSQESVATIENNGTATLLQVGSTTIEAAVTIDGIRFKSQTSLVVTNNLIESISISPEGIRDVAKGNSRSYIAVAKIDGFDFPIPITGLATWTSSRPNDVSISVQGKFAVAETNSTSQEGNVTITAQYRSAFDSVILQVVQEELVEIKVSHDPTGDIYTGDAIKFIALGIYSDESEKNLSAPLSISWESNDTSILEFRSGTLDNKNIADVTNTGKVEVTAKEKFSLFPIKGTIEIEVLP